MSGVTSVNTCIGIACLIEAFAVWFKTMHTYDSAKNQRDGGAPVLSCKVLAILLHPDSIFLWHFDAGCVVHSANLL